MWKVLLSLLKGGEGRKSVAGGLAWEIREAIKGKELDPEKLIELQTKINLAEASHRTLFVAGWRPFIGWICGFALAYNFVVRAQNDCGYSKRSDIKSAFIRHIDC